MFTLALGVSLALLPAPKAPWLLRAPSPELLTLAGPASEVAEKLGESVGEDWVLDPDVSPYYVALRLEPGTDPERARSLFSKALELRAKRDRGTWTFIRDPDVRAKSESEWRVALVNEIHKGWMEEKEFLRSIPSVGDQAERVVRSIQEANMRVKDGSETFPYGTISSLKTPEDILLRRLVTEVQPGFIASLACYGGVSFGSPGSMILDSGGLNFNRWLADYRRVFLAIRASVPPGMENLPVTGDEARRILSITESALEDCRAYLRLTRTPTTWAAHLVVLAGDGNFLGSSVLRHPLGSDRPTALYIAGNRERIRFPGRKTIRLKDSAWYAWLKHIGPRPAFEVGQIGQEAPRLFDPRQGVAEALDEEVPKGTEFIAVISDRMVPLLLLSCNLVASDAVLNHDGFMDRSGMSNKEEIDGVWAFLPRLVERDHEARVNDAALALAVDSTRDGIIPTWRYLELLGRSGPASIRNERSVAFLTALEHDGIQIPRNGANYLIARTHLAIRGRSRGALPALQVPEIVDLVAASVLQSDSAIDGPQDWRYAGNVIRTPVWDDLVVSSKRAPAHRVFVNDKRISPGTDIVTLVGQVAAVLFEDGGPLTRDSMLAFLSKLNYKWALAEDMNVEIELDDAVIGRWPVTGRVAEPRSNWMPFDDLPEALRADLEVAIKVVLERN